MSRVSIRRILVAALIGTALLAIGLVGYSFLVRSASPYSDDFSTAQKSVAFPLYYPAYLPSYYFIEHGSVSTSNGVVIFPINRNDGKKIAVTEQTLPPEFDPSQVSGTKGEVAGLGKVVIGTGFEGYRAIVSTDRTLLIITSSDQISASDFGAIVKGFRRAN